MAKLWLPDSRLEQPELFEPGRKPVGRVKIDWSNPITEGLEFLSLTETKINMVSGRSSDVYDFLPTINNNGKAIDPDAGIGLYFKAGNINEVRDDITLFSTIRYNSTHTGAIMMRDEYGGGGGTANRTYQLMTLVGSASLRCILWPGVAIGQIDISAGYHTVATTKSGTQGKVWVDKDYVAFTAPAILDKTGSGLTIGSNSQETDGSIYQLPFQGDISLSIEWGRGLSDIEIISMTDDPYQFLISA